MEICFRDAVTVLHGMGFGAFLLLGFSGVLVILLSSSVAGHPWTPKERRYGGYYLGGMAVLAWAAVLVGAYVIYPWYRAIAPVGTADLGGYPQRLLMSNPTTTGWHDIGMEWKEHIAWFAPITLTALTYLFVKYGPQLPRFRWSSQRHAGPCRHRICFHRRCGSVRRHAEQICAGSRWQRADYPESQNQ